MLISLSIYTLFSTNDGYTDLFQTAAIAYDGNGNVVSVMPYYWRWVCAAIIVVNITVNMVYEKYVVALLVQLYERLNPNSIYQGVFVPESKIFGEVPAIKKAEAPTAIYPV
jgi:hypothetical protein